MSDPKIILLCNSRIAIPALRELIFFNRVAAIVIPARNKALEADIAELLQGIEVILLLKVKRSDFTTVLQQEIVRTAVPAVLVMTFPYLIPAELLSLPPKGFINFHYGRLPEYRGPEPIFTQVRAQEKNPALCVHVITEGLDSGPVIMQEELEYSPADTYGVLQRKMAGAGAKLVNVLLKILSYGSFVPAVPQDESRAAYHSKPGVADLMIDWEKMDSNEIQALTNACNPWNKGCGTSINNQVIGITEVEILENEPASSAAAGTVVELDPVKGVKVATCDGKFIKILIFYTEEGFRSGPKLAGWGITPGSRFS